MKPFIVKNILSFLELDYNITEIATNQTKILQYLENLQDAQVDTNTLLNKNLTQPSIDYNFKNILYYTFGTILIIGTIYYFMSGGDNSEAITNLYSTISQKISANNILIDNNMKYMFDTIIKNDNHLVDVIDRILLQNNEQLKKIISIRMFNAILKNGRHLEDISKILENSNLITNIENNTIPNLKKVVFSD